VVSLRSSRLAGDKQFCALGVFGSVTIPAYQSIPEFGLSAKYHLKAVGCEQRAEQATDQATEQEWRQLAAQWHSMADRAATMSDEASQDD
jgi:hypothetical protein